MAGELDEARRALRAQQEAFDRDAVSLEEVRSLVITPPQSSPLLPRRGVARGGSLPLESAVLAAVPLAAPAARDDRLRVWAAVCTPEGCPAPQAPAGRRQHTAPLPVCA